MKWIGLIPAAATTIFTAAAPTVINTVHVSCGNVAGASFYLKYIGRNGGTYFLSSKNFTPPQLSTWDYPGVPFTMEPGDSLVASASDGTNYDLMLD